jgi:hypothetical protein
MEDALLERAKKAASDRGITLTALIEQGLRLALAQGRGGDRSSKVDLPVSKARGGVRPGVDLDDTSSLVDRMEGLR